MATSLFMFFIMAFTLAPTPVSAATAENCNKQAGGFLSIPTWYKYLNPVFVDAIPAKPDTPFVPAECKIDFKFPDNIGPVLLALVEILLRLGTFLAIAIIIWGGIQYQLSLGEPEKTKNARTTVINAVVGLMISISATAIVNLIGNNIK